MYLCFGKLKKRIFVCFAIFVAFALTGCSGNAGVSQEQEVIELTTEAGGDTPLNDSGVTYILPRIIKQRETIFGDNGCGGAAGLMALQAAGFLTELDTDAEYSEFWSSVPFNADATKGWNGNGIWNPAYAEWIGTFAEVQRVQGFAAEDIKDFLSEGNVVIVLVSLGETGNISHWMSVTGWRVADGLLLFDVADPWSGAVHEYTAARLQKRMYEGARRKGDFGAGYESDGVLIKHKAE